jgi:hypothetical protein
MIPENIDKLLFGFSAFAFLMMPLTLAFFVFLARRPTSPLRRLFNPPR